MPASTSNSEHTITTRILNLRWSKCHNMLISVTLKAIIVSIQERKYDFLSVLLNRVLCKKRWIHMRNIEVF